MKNVAVPFTQPRPSNISISVPAAESSPEEVEQ